jgi:hypothetical protein
MRENHFHNEDSTTSDLFIKKSLGTKKNFRLHKQNILLLHNRAHK